MQAEGFTVWFTGLPRSGKSTVARMLVDALRQRGQHVELLNSARIRHEMNRSLGFSREDIEISVRRLGYECALLNRNGLAAVVTAVSPYRHMRAELRKELPRFVEVYCRAPMEVLVARDTRELFVGAQRGRIQHVAGVNAPYEEPLEPDVLLNTDVESPEACIAKVTAKLESLGLVQGIEQPGYTVEEEEMIKQRLRDLGYL
ncbi:MAG: adenylyl-sulfate kinase [Phycisphaerae bacterium]